MRLSRYFQLTYLFTYNVENEIQYIDGKVQECENHPWSAFTALWLVVGTVKYLQWIVRRFAKRRNVPRTLPKRHDGEYLALVEKAHVAATI